MPPRSLSSRYALVNVRRRTSDGVALLLKRVPFRFRHFTDNRSYVVSEQDTLFSLAWRFFSPLPDASQFWWVIADFQPEPIVDPTRVLVAGRHVVIPSVRVLQTVILSEARRPDIEA